MVGHTRVRGTGGAVATVAALAGLLLACLVAVPAAAAPPAAVVAAAATCPASTVTRVVNGVRSCVPRSSYAVPARPRTLTATDLGLGPRLLPLPVRPGKKVVSAATPKAWRTTVAAVASGQLELQRRVRAARDAAPRVASLVPRGGPSFVVNTNSPDRVSGTMTQTLAAGDGAKATLALDLGASLSAGGENPELNIGLQVTVERPGASTVTKGLRLQGLTGSTSPTCPTATGDLRTKVRYGVTVVNGESFDTARVKLGRIREGYTVKVTTEAFGRLDRRARLQPVPFRSVVEVDYSRSVQGLAFFSTRTRVVATTTLSGTIDPASGQLGGATSSTTARGDASAAVRASFASAAEKTAREAVGQVLASLKAAEANARGGKCTTVDFSPSSGAVLAPNDSLSLRTELRVKGGGAVPAVDWVAAPARGRIAPTSSAEAAPSFQVTGAATGPQTAAITFTATSPAGISTATWTASGDAPPPISVTITGRITGEAGAVTGGADVSLTFDADPVPGDTLNYAPTTAVTWQVSSPTASTTNPCTASVTSVDPGPPMAAPSILAHRNDDGGYSVWAIPVVTLGITEQGDGCLNAEAPFPLFGGFPVGTAPIVTLPRTSPGATVGPVTLSTTAPFGGATYSGTYTVTVTER